MSTTREQQNIEWKESWREEYFKWICGFANAQGGRIYLGKNDDGHVVGLPNIRKLFGGFTKPSARFDGHLGGGQPPRG